MHINYMYYLKLNLIRLHQYTYYFSMCQLDLEALQINVSHNFSQVLHTLQILKFYYLVQRHSKFLPWRVLGLLTLKLKLMNTILLHNDHWSMQEIKFCSRKNIFSQTISFLKQNLVFLSIFKWKISFFLILLIRKKIDTKDLFSSSNKSWNEGVDRKTG